MSSFSLVQSERLSHTLLMTNTKYEMNFRSGFATQDNWKEVEIVCVTGRGKYATIEVTLNGVGPIYGNWKCVRKAEG